MELICGFRESAHSGNLPGARGRHSPDEPGVIELRRVGRKPNEGLVELLRSCPVKGFHIPKRSKELPRDFEL